MPSEEGAALSPTDEALCAASAWDFSALSAVFVNCTLKRSPERSHTQRLADRSIAIMRRLGVAVEVIRAVDHDVATGVYPDMTEHGWARDDWPAIFGRVMAADVLVVLTPIWLGEKSSVCTRVIERLYGNSAQLNDRGQYAYYGRVGGCLVTGKEDGAKHCATEVLYALQHLGYTIPPQADAAWIGEAGPGPSYLDEGSGGPPERLHQPQHDVHDLEPPAHRPDAARQRRRPRPWQPARPLGPRAPGAPRQPRAPLNEHEGGAVTMDPEDRLETVAKTKAGAKREEAQRGDEAAPGAAHRVPRAEVARIIEDWPAAPKKVAEETLERYGAPHEATPTLLIWHDSGPWKRTIITSDETAHDFPTPHTDYISQTINYDVPVEKLAELARFDGSLIVYRTAGQVTASCDTEAANMLSVNLMHEIVEGRMTADEARRELGEAQAAWLLHRDAPLADAIRFPLPGEAQTGHRDEPVMKVPTVHQTVEKVKDKLGLNG